MLLSPIMARSMSFCYGDDTARATMERVFSVADMVTARNWYYMADFYYRGNTTIDQHNLAVRFMPNSSFFEKGGKTLITESTGLLEFNNPAIFNRRLTYTYSSTPGYSLNTDDFLQFSSLTIYSQHMLQDHLLSPLNKANLSLYKYTTDSIRGNITYISYRPHHRNTELVSGSFAYDDSMRCVTSINADGKYEYLKFRIDITLTPSVDIDRYWPLFIQVNYNCNYFLNKFHGRCLFTQKYLNCSIKKNRHRRCNNTELYEFRFAPEEAKYDSLAMVYTRTIPLDSFETDIYKRSAKNSNIADSLSTASKQDANRKSSIFQRRFNSVIGSIGDIMFANHNMNVTSTSTMHFSPLDISYSGWKGVSLREDMKYTWNTNRGTQFRFSPSVGYNFRPGQIAWRINTGYTYWTHHDASIEFEAGNNSHITALPSISRYPTNINDDIADSIIKETHFSDVYLHLQHNIEIVNGVRLLTGLVLHHRKPYDINDDTRHLAGLRNTYNTLFFHANLKYIPFLHYYYHNGKKTPLYSNWPILNFDYERGLRALKSNDEVYEKWEMDVSYDWKPTPITRLVCKIGGGLLTNRHNVNFVYYTYFNDGTIDYNWNDELSGVFHLLDSKYYNAGYNYVRAHAVYETPALFLMRYFNTSFIRNERLYINTLYTSALRPYIEFGYGISSHLIDISAFASYIKKDFGSAGVKFTVHL